MNTQDTSVHIKLWHRDFWLMLIANLLLSIAVYMLVPTLPHWMLDRGFLLEETGIAMGAFAFGLFLPGPFCSYLVQRYRRNWVCMLAILALTACFTILFYQEEIPDYNAIILLRVVLGASFGLAQMVLSSTLIIDASESFRRTEANYSSSWFSRFGLSLGPLMGLFIYKHLGYTEVLLLGIMLATVSILLILSVNFPFKTPSDKLSVFSLDRFFLPESFPLFVNLFVITSALGLVLSVVWADKFYALLMIGFLLALLSKRFVFKDAELKSEVVTGLILMGEAVLLLLTRKAEIVGYISPLFIGLGIGIIGSRFLLFFIKLSRHCQRGTSQSTFLLAWESGIAVGLGVGYGLFHIYEPHVYIVSFGLICLALIAYIRYTHQWFVRHKNR